LRFRIPYAKAFDELELGYNRAASPGVHRLWIRLDGFFNSSHFFDYRKGVAAMMTAQTLRSNNTDNNWALSDGIDYQVTQPDSTRPRRGLYEGFTVQYDPPQQNLFTNYFELRSYYIGPFARRPNDMLTVMINNIEFSKLGVGVLEQIPVFFSGGHAPASTGNHTQGNYGVSWIAHIKSGMSMNAGVEYTVHTMVTPQAPNSIVGSVGLGLIF
jgi:porin